MLSRLVLQVGSRRLALGACGGASVLYVASAPTHSEADIPIDPASSDDNPFRGDARYFAYLARVKTLFVAGSRYLAYSSDVGESLRPVLPSWMVNACYGVAFAYVGCDVGYVGWKAHGEGKDNSEIGRAVTLEFSFQVLASLLMPTVIIHTAVHQSQKLLKNNKSAVLARWGPCLLGLALIPAMPYLDHPVEHAIETGFNMLWPEEDSEVAKEKTPPQESQAEPTILPPPPSVAVSASTVPAAPVRPPAALAVPLTIPPAPILAPLPAPDKAELDKKEVPLAEGCPAKELPSTSVAAPAMAAPATTEQADANTTQPKIQHVATGCLVVATLALLTKIAFEKPS